jgi:hypothetical protein
MSKIDLGAIRDQANQKLHDAWKTSTGDVPQVAGAPAAAAPPPQAAAAPRPQAAPQSGLRTDAIGEGSQRVSDWSRELYRAATGGIIK